MYGVCPRTAWFILHRVRENLNTDAHVESMRGTLVSDEAWIGGKPLTVTRQPAPSLSAPTG